MKDVLVDVMQNVTMQKLDCNCVCGGRNHSAGLKKSRQNTIDYANEILEENDKKNLKVVFEDVQEEIAFT